MTSNEAAIQHPPLLDDIILHENNLTEQAKSLFSYHGEILRGFESYQRSILGNEHMTSVGRHLALSELAKLHTICKRVLNYVAEHKELLGRNLPTFGPLMISGLPRTGSTLLYNLLACDPDCRAPLFTDMNVEIVPPISRSNLVEQKNRMTVQLSMEQNAPLTSQRSRIIASHPIFSIDEDYDILRQASFLPFFTTIKSDQKSTADTWLSDEMNKDYVYDYHEMFLHMLNSVDAPRSHWLLKSPLHSLHLDTLVRHYPNVALIMTHRRLDEVLPSLFSMGWPAGEIYLDKPDAPSRDAVMTQNLQFFDKAIDCIMEFRTRKNHVLDQLPMKIFDVAYNDLMEQPIATVHRIYDHFGLRWSDEFEAAMYEWLRENPQGKQGRNTYSLDEFGLTRENIETQYADYINFFSVLPPSSDTSSASSDQFLSTNEHLNKPH